MKKFRILLPLLAGFAATPAYAQDLGISARVELRGGYDEVRADLTVQNSAFETDFGVGDYVFGAEAGIDARIFPGVSVGAYAGIDMSQVDECVNRPFAAIAPSRTDIVCVDAGQNFSLGIRAGIPVGNEGLIYAKGGYSRGTFEGSYNSNTTTQVFSGRDTVDGYHFGGGFEISFGGGLYGKAEYVQHRYERAFTSMFTGTNQYDPLRHQLVAGIGFRFGGGSR